MLLNRYEGKYIYVSCDVKEKASLQRLWDLSIQQWVHIDIWINNAGRGSPLVYVWDTLEADTEAIIQTNLTGLIYGSQIAACEMIKQGHGSIYSMEGLGSNNMIQAKTILYGTTKHALSYFMKGLAKELKGTGVIVGRLSPGMMLTDFITKNSDGSKSEVILNKSFVKIFNILADEPDTVARFFIPRILRNTRNNIQIAWLTNRKVIWRFIGGSLRRNRLIRLD